MIRFLCITSSTNYWHTLKIAVVRLSCGNHILFAFLTQTPDFVYIYIRHLCRNISQSTAVVDSRQPEAVGSRQKYSVLVYGHRVGPDGFSGGSGTDRNRKRIIVRHLHGYLQLVLIDTTSCFHGWQVLTSLVSSVKGVGCAEMAMHKVRPTLVGICRVGISAAPPRRGDPLCLMGPAGYTSRHQGYQHWIKRNRDSCSILIRGGGD